MQSLLKKPVLVGRTIMVLNERGEALYKMDAVELAKHFFTMRNDAFFERYGFNWIPTGEIYQIARDELAAEQQEMNAHNMEAERLRK